MTIKEIAVVHPDVLVLLLQAQIVAFVGIHVHETDIPDLDILGALDTETPAVCRSIVADTLNSHRQAFFLVHIHENIALVGIGWVRNVPHQTNYKRPFVIAFFKSIQNILESNKMFRSAFVILRDF